MRKVIFFLVLSFLIYGNRLKAEILAEFSDHINPTQIFVDVDKDSLIVIELPKVSIYSLKDYTLKKRFGKSGEGPREFRIPDKFSAATLLAGEIQDEKFLVNSFGKVSIFSGSGDFIWECTVLDGQDFMMLGDKFVGQRRIFDEKANVYLAQLCIYDSQLKPEKPLLNKESFIRSKKGNLASTTWHFFSKSFSSYLFTDKKIFYSGCEEGFKIDVFDDKGNSLPAIERKDFEFVEFKKEHGEKVLLRFRTDPRDKSNYEYWKRAIKFPTHFPPIRSIHADDKILFIRTYKQVGNKTEFYVYSTEGKFLKKIFLPLHENNSPYKFPFLKDTEPFTFSKGKLYQLVNNEDKETYELHVEKIDI